MRSTALLRRAGELDRRVVARVASAESPVLDHVLPRLSEAANHSVVWLAIGLGMAATGNRRARRAALRGLAGVAIASTAANVVAKGLTRRARPGSEIPVLRRLMHPPTTSSFPSGHAASAAAFTTGVALEAPVLAAPVGALALAVGASRVVTGVHYPTDVLAGFALGAAAGALTVHWWPLRSASPAGVIRPRRQAPAAPTGDGLVLAVQAAADTSPRLAQRLRARLPDAEIIDVGAGTDVPDLGAVLHAAAGRARILGVAGGDGAANVAAGVAQLADLPLLLIPAGAANEFTADLGVDTAGDALAALGAGDAVLVDVAVAGHRAFLNSWSTGGYADLVHARQRLERRIGRWPALIVALAQVLRTSRPQDVHVNGLPMRLWLFFAGNCCYTPQGFAPSYRPELADGKLDIRVVDATFPFARLRLLTAVLTGTLGCTRVYRAWAADQVEIAAADGAPIKASVDGAAGEASETILLGKRPGPLLVYRREGPVRDS